MVDNKLNKSKLKAFSDKFSINLCDLLYQDQTVVSASQLKEATPIDQVNYFIINSLFLSWKEQIKNSQSPFFDYESQAVKEAQKQYMNILSRHIAIKRNYMEPLISTAVFDTLNLLLNPKVYFKKNLLKMHSKDGGYLNAWIDSSKYIKINTGIKEAILIEVSKKRDQKLSEEEVLEILEKGMQMANLTTEDLDPYLELFSISDPNGWNIFLKNNNGANASAEKVESKITDFEQEEQTEEKEEPKMDWDQSRSTDESFLNEAEESEKPNTILNQLNETGVKPLAEQLGDAQTETLAQKITLNQRFMFISELFGGDASRYNEIIQKIDSIDEVNEVQQIIIQDLVPTYDWDRNSEEVKEFMDLIRAKFMTGSST